MSGAESGQTWGEAAYSRLDPDLRERLMAQVMEEFAEQATAAFPRGARVRVGRDLDEVVVEGEDRTALGLRLALIAVDAMGLPAGAVTLAPRGVVTMIGWLLYGDEHALVYDGDRAD